MNGTHRSSPRFRSLALCRTCAMHSLPLELALRGLTLRPPDPTSHTLAQPPRTMSRVFFAAARAHVGAGDQSPERLRRRCRLENRERDHHLGDDIRLPTLRRTTCATSSKRRLSSVVLAWPCSTSPVLRKEARNASYAKRRAPAASQMWSQTSCKSRSPDPSRTR